MKQRNWIALAAALGIALTGCSSMHSGDNDRSSSSGTMRRADSGSTTSSGSTSSPSSTTSPGTRSTPDSRSTADCTPDAAGKTPAGCPEEVLSSWCSKAKTAPNPDALSKVWTDGLAVIKPTKDMRAYNTFKETVSARGNELKKPPADSNTIDVQAKEVSREPGSDDADLQADFERQMAKENAA